MQKTGEADVVGYLYLSKDAGAGREGITGSLSQHFIAATGEKEWTCHMAA